jgi:hypothetical protein
MGSKSTTEKVRLTIDLSLAFYERLGQLEQDVDAESKAQLIREALRLYEYLIKRSIEGDEFLVRAKDGQEQHLLLLAASGARMRS